MELNKLVVRVAGWLAGWATQRSFKTPFGTLLV
jgi:hypothetical protein